MSNVKLIKTSIQKRGRNAGLKYYEYGVSDEDHAKCRQNQITERNRLLLGIEKYKVTDSGRYELEYERICKATDINVFVPKITELDIRACEENHFDEGLIKTIKKHNGNFQIYVGQLEETPEAKENICEVCGFQAKSIQGLKMHRARWCKGKPE